MQTLQRIKADKIAVRKTNMFNNGQRHSAVTLSKGDEERSIHVKEEHARLLVGSLDVNCLYNGLVYSGSLKVKHSKDIVTVMIFVNYSKDDMFYMDLSIEEFKRSLLNLMNCWRFK